MLIRCQATSIVCTPLFSEDAFIQQSDLFSGAGRSNTISRAISHSAPSATHFEQETLSLNTVRAALDLRQRGWAIIDSVLSRYDLSGGDH